MKNFKIDKNKKMDTGDIFKLLEIIANPENKNNFLEIMNKFLKQR
jgi:hypothetical protein